MTGWKFLKGSAISILMKAGLYERLKGSRVYDIYFTIADRRVIRERAGEVEFYRRTLQGFRKGDLIFDVGANQGYKTDIFLRLGARVVAIDPDQANHQRLRRRFLKYRIVRKPVRIVEKAVSDSNAVATMWIDGPGSAKNTLSPKWVATLRQDEKRFGRRLAFADARSVETATLADLMEAYGVPFFIKIDVEGHEAGVLRGMRRPVPFVSFEVNLPEFRIEGVECIDALRQSLETGEFNFTTDCQAGLALEKWLPHSDFKPVFEEISDRSVEVFWRTPLTL